MEQGSQEGILDSLRRLLSAIAMILLLTMGASQAVSLIDMLTDRWIAYSHSMMFNTGDLARWLPDGSLETLGRNDDQVKIKVGLHLS